MVDEFGRARPSRPISQVFGDPAIQVQELAVGELGVGVGTTEEEQCLDDLPSWTALPRADLRTRRYSSPGAFLPQGNLDLSDQDRQRRSQLVRGIAAESSLPLVGDVQPRQEVVEGSSQVVQLVAGPGQFQAPAGVGRVQLAGRLDHPRHRGQAPGGRAGDRARPPSSQIPALKVTRSHPRVASVDSLGSSGAQTVKTSDG